MVSLRRHKFLKLCSGINSFNVEIPRAIENGNLVEIPNENTSPASVHPLPEVIIDDQKLVSEEPPECTKISGSFSRTKEAVHNFPDKQIRYRKEYKRKQHKDQELSIMRGVYFKNTKWQAAIKVDKKQIHLGTVESQEEAARLYDRAAFICGRRPNFELSEEEKQELSRYNWKEFLEMTRSSISSRKQQRRQIAASRQKRPEPRSQNSDPNHGGRHATSASIDEMIL